MFTAPSTILPGSRSPDCQLKQHWLPAPEIIGRTQTYPKLHSFFSLHTHTHTHIGWCCWHFISTSPFLIFYNHLHHLQSITSLQLSHTLSLSPPICATTRSSPRPAPPPASASIKIPPVGQTDLSIFFPVASLSPPLHFFLLPSSSFLLHPLNTISPSPTHSPLIPHKLPFSPLPFSPAFPFFFFLFSPSLKTAWFSLFLFVDEPFSSVLST